MASEEPKRPRRRKKLGRGLSDISHVFLSGAERNGPGFEPDHDPALWTPDVDILSITSGDGVRGKTFLAANLAFGLAVEGYRIALMNADPNRPDILDVTGAERPYGVEDGANSNPVFGSIPEADLVGGCGIESGWAAQTESPVGAIERLARRAQRVIIDTAPRAKPSVSIWKWARLVLVITEPSSEGMKASYLTIRQVHAVSRGGRLGLVINFARDRDEADKCYRKLSNVCRRFLKTNLRNYGYIIPSEAVGEACERAVPLAREYPASKITRCIDYIVRLIVMDHLAIARRRREVKVNACVSREER
jgi:MinD-like ATPase involved in chromosome partitioning or flagellar assembly